MSLCLLNTTLHCVAPGMVTRPYAPAGSDWPSTMIVSEVVNLVISLAPVRQGLSNGTNAPQISRPLTPGRQYLIVRAVVPRVCEPLALGLTRASWNSAPQAAARPRAQASA